MATNTAGPTTPRNTTEERAKEYLIKCKWQVLRGGWPDFLCIRESKIGTIIIGIEVKSKEDRISDAQKIMHEVLKIAGLPIYILKEAHLNGEKKMPGLLSLKPEDDLNPELVEISITKLFEFIKKYRHERKHGKIHKEVS